MTIKHCKESTFSWALLSSLTLCIYLCWGFPSGSEVKNVPTNAENVGSIPGLGRSPEEGNGNPLQYSCLETPVEREA